MRGLTTATDLGPLGELPALRRLEIWTVGVGRRDAIHLQADAVVVCAQTKADLVAVALIERMRKQRES